MPRAWKYAAEAIKPRVAAVGDRLRTGSKAIRPGSVYGGSRLKMEVGAELVKPVAQRGQRLALEV